MGKRHPIVKYRDTAVICAKTGEPIDRDAVWVLGLDGPKDSCRLIR